MRGYADDYSRSSRAIRAEEEGRLPASRITRAWLDEAGVDEPVDLVRWMCSTGWLTTPEWHHTGSRFRRTWYWDQADVAEKLAWLRRIGLLDRARQQWRAARAQTAGTRAERRARLAEPADDGLRARVDRILSRRLRKTARYRVRRVVGDQAWQALADPSRRTQTLSSLTRGQAEQILRAARQR